MFSGTIETDGPATVGYEFGPIDSSTVGRTKTFTAAGRKFVSRVRIVRGKPGEPVDGAMTLTAWAPGGPPVSATASYSLTCG
ncbi:hypothetical protein Ari01nite_72680 [Paractinoplanes rishiriensis]|uniref:Uncharacterized protein n=2 Tax=Paractinoplanes rishiriensis TaxID=1050105 RepID=A0A919MY67_9ACTN|nr:hypothetical protein Ari01nite_72680 [Actinoplanes rishiriensis]